ncbi:MAG: hypothetical protein EBS72_03525 [Rhizobiales bacterium]|jgi:hypothetical protein|nr:hypothetical protein [Hyphomicrobiales bacterium]
MVYVPRKRATHGSYTSKYFVLKPLQDVVERDLLAALEARRLIRSGKVKTFEGDGKPFVLADQLRRHIKV